MPESPGLSRADPAIGNVGAAGATGCLPDGFVPLRVKRVIRETGEAISIVLDVP